MSNDEVENEERPCLHCLIVELMQEFFEEHTVPGEQDTIDVDEVVTAVAKTVAELTSNEDGAVRQNIIEQLMREIMKYAEFRREGATGTEHSRARH
jgi:hypothetical protein